MKKYTFGIVSIVVLSLLLLFAYVVRFKPVSELMRSPMADGENAEIQLAFENSVGKRYRMKAPLSGKYRSAYIETDIDGDNENEVVVFYEKSDTDDVVRMNLLRKIDNVWRSIADVKSDYGEIQQVQFADLDGDGINEIIVGWGIYDNLITRNLNVYQVEFSDDIAVMNEIYSRNYSDFKIMDIDGDGNEDILKVNYIQTDSSSQCEAVFLKYKSKEIAEIDSIVLTPAIGTITNISSDFNRAEKVRRIFIDGYKADSFYLTECIYWNIANKKLERYYSGKIALSALSARISNISSQDINNDGIIEVPTQYAIKKNDENKCIVSWLSVSKKNVQNELYQIVNENDGYFIEIDADDVNSISVVMNSKNDTLTVLSNKNQKSESEYLPLFSVKTMDADEENSNSFFKYLDSFGSKNYYYRILDEGKKEKITKRDIKVSFSFGGERE